MRNLIRLLLSMAVLCAAGLLALAMTEPVVGPVEPAEGKNIITMRDVPSVSVSKPGAALTYGIDIRRAGQPVYAYVVSSECIEALTLNGAPYPIASAVPTPRRWCPNLSKTWVKLDGKSNADRLVAVIRNLNALSGMNVEFSPWPLHLPALLKSLGLVSLVMALVLAGGLASRFGRAVTCLLPVSLLLAFLYYFTSSYTHLTYDYVGHSEYILSLAVKHRLPDPFGWQSQQPPFYYFIAAAFFNAARMLGYGDPYYAARFVSLLCYIGFLLLSLLTLARFFAPGKWLVIASSLVLFWPENFVYAARLSNDLGILLVHAAVLYLLVRFAENKEKEYLQAALVTAFFGLTIKGSAVMGIAATLMMALIAWRRREIGIRFFIQGWVVAAAVIGIGLNFGRTLYWRVVEGGNVKWFINLEVEHLSGVLVGNTPYNFVTFDFAKFIREPYYYTDPLGGDLVLNAMLKTLLLGEWFWNAPIAAHMVSVLLVVILIYALWFALFRITRENIEPYLPLLLMAGCMVGAVICARIDVPWSAQANGRYIQNIVVIIAIFFTRGLQLCHRGGHVIPEIIGYVSALAFPLLGVVLIWNELLIFAAP